jgi:hypothetical protein
MSTIPTTPRSAGGTAQRVDGAAGGGGLWRSSGAYENADIRRRLLEGELLPNVAAVAVQSINTDIRAVGAALRAREQEELVERLEVLEEALEHQKEGRRYGA